VQHGSSERIVLALVVGASCLAARAPAQEGDFFEQESSYFQGKTVEGASKHAEAPGEAPATVTIVSREEIERYGFRTVSDVLNFASLGSFAAYDRRYDLAGSRGLFFAEDFNTRILVMLNGHALNEPWANFAGIGREMLVPLDLVERIEIVYGPSSLLYGGYSLFGIVNVITRTGSSLPGLRLRLSAGTWRTGEAVFSSGACGVAGGQEGSGTEWTALVAVGAYSSEGENLDLPRQEMEDPAQPGGRRIWGGPQSGTDFERAPFVFVHARRGDFTFLSRLGFRKRGAPFAPYGALYGSTRQSLRDQKTFAELRWDHAFASGVSLSARVFHDIYRYDERDPYGDPLVEGAAPGYDFVLSTDDHDSGLEARATYQRGTHFLTAGAEFRYRTLAQESFDELPDGSVAPGTTIRDDVNGRFGVAYLQEEWRPHEKVSLVAGGSFGHTRPGGSKALPRLALIVKPRPNLSVKALYAMGFRPPSVYEASYGDFLTKIPNPALRSEEIGSTELSVLWNVGRGASIEGYGFRSRLDGLIQGVEIASIDQVQGGVLPPSGDPEDLVGQLQYQSTGSVRSSGAGVALRLKSAQAQGFLNVAYARARQEDVDAARRDLAGSARWLASAGASTTHGAWTASLVARYQGPQPLHPTFGAGETHAFVEGWARLLYRTRIVYPVTFQLDVRNLTDTHGEIAASPVYAIPRLPIEGRSLLLGAEVRF
jgi:outer membrane receptor for ferrienterochelin and colicins